MEHISVWSMLMMVIHLATLNNIVENTKVLLNNRKETGLVVKAEKTKVKITNALRTCNSSNILKLW